VGGNEVFLVPHARMTWYTHNHIERKTPVPTHTQ